MKMQCPRCGANLPTGATSCGNCGVMFQQEPIQRRTKYCQHCGKLIDEDCVVCPICGKQVAQLKAEQPSIVINNTNDNNNQNFNGNFIGFGRPKNKVVALILCICLGYLGAHKFYEDKPGLGVLYLCTLGLFGFGWVIDIIILLSKPYIYYV